MILLVYVVFGMVFTAATIDSYLSHGVSFDTIVYGLLMTGCYVSYLSITVGT